MHLLQVLTIRIERVSQSRHAAAVTSSVGNPSAVRCCLNLHTIAGSIVDVGIQDRAFSQDVPDVVVQEVIHNNVVVDNPAADERQDFFEGLVTIVSVNREDRPTGAVAGSAVEED